MLYSPRIEFWASHVSKVGSRSVRGAACVLRSDTFSSRFFFNQVARCKVFTYEGAASGEATSIFAWSPRRFRPRCVPSSLFRFAESLGFSLSVDRWPFRCKLRLANKLNTMPSQTKRFHSHPLLKELRDLHATESTLEQRYVLLQRTKKPRQTAIVQFVTELVRLRLRLEGLNRTLNLTG